MTVTVKLFATFRTGRFKTETRSYPPGTTCAAVVADVGLQEKELGVVLVNSRHAPLDQELHEGDSIALFPLVGGG